MSFAEVLQELPALSLSERQQVIRQALELDDSPLSPQDESLVAERLAEHHKDPGSSLPLDAVKSRLRSLYKK
jgi:hypothetical protein